MKVTLIKGTSYTYKGVKYLKGVEKDAPVEDMPTLKATGRFKVGDVVPEEKVKAKPKRNHVVMDGNKAIVVKETEAKPKIKLGKKEEVESVEIPTFRSKQELADYAMAEFEIDLSTDQKMVEMNDQLHAILEERKAVQIEADGFETELKVDV